jgi:hypothetical protein
MSSFRVDKAKCEGKFLNSEINKGRINKLSEKGGIGK